MSAEAITLTVVGCSGSTSGPDSPASSYLVQAPWRGGTYTVLLDCGPGAFGALYRHLDDPRQIDAIALSHLHPDHCLDLCAFFVAARHSPTAPWPPVDLYGPPGTLDRLTRAYDPGPDRTADPSADPQPDPDADFGTAFVPRDWQPVQQIGPFTVRTVRVDHPAPCWATRFEVDGASLVYSGDTGPTDALTELSRDADLLLCEAAFAEPRPDRPGLHLTGGQAGTIATAAAVRQLVITHVPPWHDRESAAEAAAATFAGAVEPASPGAVWRLPAGPGARAVGTVGAAD